MTANEYIKVRFGRHMDQCTNEEIYVGLLEYVKDKAKSKEIATGKKKLYYISAEFLIGKLLSNNLINLLQLLVSMVMELDLHITWDFSNKSLRIIYKTRNLILG